ncbi:MAG: hypothetical protein WBA93_01230 [Microcoleaceae cyanobacterium]
MRHLEYIKLAKEFADTYGIEYLERIMALAENNKFTNTQPTPTKTNQEIILDEVVVAGFQLNPWLKNLILINSEEVVRKAVAVVQQNEMWGNVRNREGLLVDAIRNQWKPNRLA